MDARDKYLCNPVCRKPCLNEKCSSPDACTGNVGFTMDARDKYLCNKYLSIPDIAPSFQWSAINVILIGLSCIAILVVSLFLIFLIWRKLVADSLESKIVNIDLEDRVAEYN
ncbi:hypothetical protein FQA39_LY00742 [Lamprigera yunnana]|nr:hypothetical protein FQA39_LY00742 [Lamprigera yunnana]